MEKLQVGTNIESKNEITLKKKDEKAKSNSILNYINLLALPTIIVGLWIMATRLELFSPAILPSISTVFDSLKSQISSGQLIKDIGVSLLRVVEGYLIAATLGIVFGVVIHSPTIIIGKANRLI